MVRRNPSEIVVGRALGSLQAIGFRSPMMSGRGLVVRICAVLPTRNRAALLEKALAHALATEVHKILVVEPVVAPE